MKVAFVTLIACFAQVAFHAHAAPAKSYKNPVTGEDCVQLTTGPQDSDKYRFQYFKNTCDLQFSVKMVLATGQVVGTGILRNGTMRLGCEIAKGECGKGSWSYD